MLDTSISKEKLVELARSSPEFVVALLQGYELGVMKKLQPGGIHPEDKKEIVEAMPLSEIFRAVRNRVWKATPLPASFPQPLRSLADGMSDYPQRDIGVVTENDADIEQVRAWLRGMLKETSIRFEQRSWCDGEASIEIIALPDIPSDLGNLLRREKQTSK